MAVPPPRLAMTPAPPTSDAAADKAALRQAMRRARDAFVASGPPPLVPPPPLLELIATGMVVAAYRPIGGEADPQAVIDAAIARGARIALPHVAGRRDPMRWLGWAPGEPLERGPLGVWQPRAAAADLVPALILAPLTAFDRALNRLGQGAGYYARAFAALPHARRVGIAWSVQQVARVPTDPWDVPLHAVLTECEWIPPA